MGNLATPEPASNRHGRLRAEVAAQLKAQLGGSVVTECSTLTRIGTRVPDVAWMSSEFLAAYGEITPYQRAPEICVEIVSLSNTSAEIEEKKAAYLAAGTREVWLLALDGTVRYFDASGERQKSAFSIAVMLPPPIQ